MEKKITHSKNCLIRAEYVAVVAAVDIANLFGRSLDLDKKLK